MRVDIVLLQEVVKEVLPTLAAELPAYHVIPSDQSQRDYTVILLHSKSMTLVDYEARRFPNTQMNRMLQVAKVIPQFTLVLQFAQ